MAAAAQPGGPFQRRCSGAGTGRRGIGVGALNRRVSAIILYGPVGVGKTHLGDFAMRAFTGPQAHDLYELTSDRSATGKPLIINSNRAPTDWYPFFPNPVVAEFLLDRLINTSHQLLVDGPSYRPRKRPGSTKPVASTPEPNNR